MTIKQQGGVFGRNPTFNDVTVDGDFDGKHIDLNDDLPYINLNSTDSSATPRGFGIKINGTEIASIRTNPSTGDLQIISGFTGWGGKTSFYTNGNLAGQFDSTGNLAFPAGQGIDFSATAGTGTSELFDDYEEGTWTPTDQSGAGLTLTPSGCTYTKVGRLVTISGIITFPVTASSAAISIGGLPFTQASGNVATGALASDSGIAATIALFASGVFVRNANNGDFINANLSGFFIFFSASYIS